ncbi:hypothetical protein FRB95_002620 [Tulasnella sp. JGI-2019a]|nr:hypothetical protein FRB95_002620 [Tulasnella sp. JGI-2019a]
MPILSRGTPEPTWEVVDHQEISAVPTYHGNSAGFEITSVSPHVVTRTYTFNAPASSSKLAPPLTPKRQRSVLSVLKRKSTSASSSSSPSRTPSFLRCPSRHSSASTCTSEDESSEPASSTRSCASSTMSSDVEHEEEKHISMREAVIFARQQLMNSSDVKRVRGDILYSEGWSVTRLRKGNQHRLEVKYFGRPARIALLSPSSSTPSSQPPFMEMLEDSWY